MDWHIVDKSARNKGDVALLGHAYNGPVGAASKSCSNTIQGRSTPWGLAGFFFFFFLPRPEGVHALLIFAYRLCFCRIWCDVPQEAIFYFSVKPAAAS